MSKKLFTIFLIIGISAVQTFASGFQINENGARAMGMSGAFVGLADDPSAVYFNPAGITQLLGTHFSIGATFISPSTKFTGPANISLPAALGGGKSQVYNNTESKLKSRWFTPFNVYVTHQLGNDLFVGLGVNNPYGLGTEWDDNWVGRYKTIKAEIQTFTFEPVVAYKLLDQLSISLGGMISYADVDLQQKIPMADATTGAILAPDATLQLKGNKLAYGFTAGVLYKPINKLSLGVSFHSEIKYKFEGDATPTYAPGVPASPMVPHGKITAPLTTPLTLTFGAAYIIQDDWSVSADIQYTGWSSYDSLVITFNDFQPTGKPYVSASVRDYKNNIILRLGTEVKINEKLTARGGALYDQNPVPDARLDPTLPDANRIGLNIGLGYKITNNLSVDVAYLFLIFSKREVTNSIMEKTYVPFSLPAALGGGKIVLPETAFNGTYETSANLIGLNLSYSL